MVDVAGTEDLLDTVTQLKRLRGADGGAASAETEESSMAAAVAAAASSNDVETVLDIEASAPDTPPTSPISGRDHEVQEDSISGGHLANPPFLLPDSGFASPASEDVVSAAEDVGAATDGFTMRRRSTRMRAAGANKDEQFRQRLTKQRHRDRLFELREDGSYEMKEMTIREVFAYVQGRIEAACARQRCFLSA